MAAVLTSSLIPLHIQVTNIAPTYPIPDLDSTPSQGPLKSVVAVEGDVFGFHTRARGGTPIPAIISKVNGSALDTLYTSANFANYFGIGYVAALDAFLVVGSNYYLYFRATGAVLTVDRADPSGVAGRDPAHAVHVDDLDNVFIVTQQCGCGCDQ